MTQFIATAQAALDALPDDVDFLHIGLSTERRFCIVQLKGCNKSGHGATVQAAYDDALVWRDAYLKLRDDAAARERAREVLAAAGLSPDMLAKG